MSRLSTTQAPVQVQLSGELAPSAADYLRQKIQLAVDHCPVPLHSVRVRLVRRDHESGGRVVAQATVAVTGKQLRVQVRASSAHEAADQLEARLWRRLERLARTSRRDLRASVPTPMPVGGTDAADPRIVRHKVVSPARYTVEDAVGDLDFMGYDFHLFIDRENGRDAVVHRTGPAAYRVAWTDPHGIEALQFDLPVTYSPEAAPRIDVAAAIDRLVATRSAFVFFVDPERDRGCLLYRRHDGDYGLISPTPH
jgi:ribosome-associated translation inhibitor RaiA